MKILWQLHQCSDAQQGKTLVVFENSARMLIMGEKEKYQERLVNVVLKEGLVQ